MSDGTKISWSDATWNVLVGCDKVSPGCDRCYAIRTAHRMQANPNPKVSGAYAGTEAGGEWTGQVNLLEDRLDQPLRWRKPRRIFVNAQSDLFHDQVPDEFIARVWAVMALAPQHTYQILTKRHGRMRSLLNRPEFVKRVGDERARLTYSGAAYDPPWPLPNVWLGVSVEDQQRALLRIPALLETPAAVRWISAEPLLGPLDLSDAIWPDGSADECTNERCTCGIDWVVVGGESGPGARPMHPDWARSLRDQCVAAGVPFHFKQWGEWAPAGYSDGTHLIQVDGRHVTRESGTVRDPYGHESGVQDLVDRGHHGWERIRRPGRKAAGRLLDGRTWDEYPGGAS